MLTKIHATLIGILFSSTLFANNYVQIPVVQTHLASADVLEVELIDSEVLIETGSFGNYENRSIKINLGIKAIASACETMKEIKYLPSQTSLESGLNPSDFYLRVNTLWKPGCGTGSFGKPQFIKLALKFSVDQRPISQAGKPWKKPDFFAKSNLRHFSFDSGMMSGQNRWKMYRIDYAQLDDVQFDFIKQYSYIQGEVIDH